MDHAIWKQEPVHKEVTIERRLLDHVEALTRSQEISSLNISVLKSLIELLDLERVNLYEVIERDNQEMAVLTAWTKNGVAQVTKNSLADDNLESTGRHPAYLACLERPELALTETLNNGKYISCLPVTLDGKIVAFFEIQAKAPLTAHQIDVIEGIIGVYKNFASLIINSQIDELTGLLNRKTFNRGLKNLLAAANITKPAKGNDRRRSHKEEDCWLAVMDIDHFKRINDEFGHLYGDEVLILMANLMRKSFRQQDKLYRFGGEEFVALIRHLNFEDVSKLLERFRIVVADYAFPQIAQVTVSIGFTSIKHSQLASVSLGHADEALYYAKGHGKNQVQCYTTLVESGLISPKRLHKNAEIF